MGRKQQYCALQTEAPCPLTGATAPHANYASKSNASRIAEFKDA